jgi:ABC-type uncharacterized transport system ATPase subunit
MKNDVSPRGRDGRAQDKNAGSADSSAIGATENEVLHRPVRSGGRDFVFQQPAKQSVLKRVGYLPEQAGLPPKARVFDTIRYLGRLKGMRRDEASRGQTNCWIWVGLYEHRLAKVDALSLA